MSNIINKMKKSISIDSPIVKIDKQDIELIKILIKEKPELGLDLDTLFKICKICKQVNGDIIRYYISFYKNIVHFNNSTTIVRFMVIDYNQNDKTFSSIITL